MAAATKLVPTYLAARPLGRGEASIVGVGMSILTTLAAPFALRRLSRRVSSA